MLHDSRLSIDSSSFRWKPYAKNHSGNQIKDVWRPAVAKAMTILSFSLPRIFSHQFEAYTEVPGDGIMRAKTKSTT